MIARFMPLYLTCGPEYRQAVPKGRHTRPTRRHARSHQPDRPRARCLVEALEDRCLLSGVSGITEFSLLSPGGALSGITTGPDGNLWFTDRGGNAIGMINPTSHAVSLFSIPTASCWPFGITAGPDGNLWFTEAFANKIGEINPTTHVISEFSLPNASNGGNGLAYPRGITAGPDGNIWFAWQGTGAGAIGNINPTTHAISYYPVSSPLFHVYGITEGPDGNLWFTQDLGSPSDYVGVINPTTDAISAFPTPSGSTTSEIAAGPDGNVWFTEIGSHQIGQINPTTHAINEFVTPSGGFGFITAGPDGNLWLTESGPGDVASINPTTDAIAEYHIPYSGTDPIAITAGPDGNIWFTDNGTNAIGVATLTTSQLVVTTEPPASVTAGSGFGLTVTAEDGSGNPITSFDGTVTVSLANNPGGAALGGTLTATASNGVATFSGLTITTAASGYTLGLSATGLGSATTSAIIVTPAAASQLVITTEPPATVKLNGTFGLQASIEDAYGNVVTTASNTVSVAFANNPTGATLAGTLSVSASQGVATFSNLTINKVGNGYTLAVSSNGLTSATTSAINVTKTGKSPSPMSVQAATIAPDPLLAPLVFDSPDLWDGVGLKKRVRTS